MGYRDDLDSNVRRLLNELCIGLGYCLPPDDIRRLEDSPPEDVDSFTDAVFEAEGMGDMRYTDSRQQVRDVVERHMNGSARHQERDGRRFYWGRAGSDDDDPRSGGVRLRWHRQSAGWHECATALPQEERGYVRTPAAANVIAGEPVTIVICLWRDQPKAERCTAPLK